MAATLGLYRVVPFVNAVVHCEQPLGEVGAGLAVEVFSFVVDASVHVFGIRIFRIADFKDVQLGLFLLGRFADARRRKGKKADRLRSECRFGGICTAVSVQGGGIASREAMR